MSELFFRVESKTEESSHTNVFNSGFYRSSDEDGEPLFRKVGLSDKDELRHPLPSEDNGVSSYWESLDHDERTQHFFGFSSFEQLKRWFYRDRRLAEVKDYIRLSVYNVKILHNGYTQAICHVDDVVELLHTFEVDVTQDEVLKVLNSFIQE